MCQNRIFLEITFTDKGYVLESEGHKLFIHFSPQKGLPELCYVVKNRISLYGQQLTWFFFFPFFPKAFLMWADV